MENKDILFLALIIFFCVCSVTALIFNAHSKSRAPVFICAVSGILVIVFSVFLLIDRPHANGRYVRDYIPITSSEETKENQKGRKTHKSEKSSKKTSLPSMRYFAAFRLAKSTSVWGKSALYFGRLSMISRSLFQNANPPDQDE